MADTDLIKELSEVVAEGDSGIQKLQKKRKKGKVLKIVLIAVVVILVLAVIAGLRSDVNMACVKSGTLSGYPTATVGDAFEDFFDSPKWGVDKKGDQQYVTFKGNCTYDGEIVEIGVRFWVNDTSFGISSMTMEGATLNALEQLIILNAVYGT
ncbi:MAG: hypothetical protein E7485_04060 [Ruminococcaceae bacterium]|nr:hypothetical protein [Oscillospiraceae bacterium]